VIQDLTYLWLLGVTDEEIRNSLPENVAPNDRLELYNSLLQRGRLQLKKLHGKLFYQAVSWLELVDLAYNLQGGRADSQQVAGLDS
jgi:hypothetical protein